MIRSQWLVLVALVSLLVSLSPAQAGGVWIEGENPSSTNVPPAQAGFRLGPLARPSWQSGGAMLNAAMSYKDAEAKLPKDGFVVAYTFDLPRGGPRTIWARVGFERARSPFDWRVDGGQWRTVGPDDYTIDLVELSLWNQIGWLKLAEGMDLDAGNHKIEFRHSPNRRTDEKGNVKKLRTLHMLDALYVTDGEFRPNGKFRPGEPYMGETDREAARKVYEVPSARQGLRSEVELTGLWQIARNSVQS